MRCRIIFLFLIASLVSQAQDNPTLLAQPIVQEGMRLYRSEMTSWYGTDLFLAKYSNRENLGGYFSYNDNEIFKCVFVSKAAQPLVIGTISFDSSFSTEIAKVDLTGRPLTTIENEYLKLRKKAIEIVNDDTIFNYYNNTSFNLIPLIDKDERKVYILTGPQKPGVVIFGNDYLLTFDNAKNLFTKI